MLHIIVLRYCRFYGKEHFELGQEMPSDLCFYIQFSSQIWFYTNDIFENAGIPGPEIQYTTAGTGIIEIIAGLVGVNIQLEADAVIL